MQQKLRPHDKLGIIAGIQIAIECVCVNRLLHQVGGKAERAGIRRVIAEAPGIRHHAGEQRRRRLRIQRPAAFLRHLRHQTAATLERVVRCFNVCNFLHEDVVVDVGGLRGKCVTGIADERLGGCIQHDGERALISTVGNLVHDRIFHKAVAPRAVTHHVHRFVRIIRQNQVLKANLTAQRITVRVGVAVQDDGLVRGDSVSNQFKHVQKPLFRQNSPCRRPCMGCSGTNNGANQ